MTILQSSAGAVLLIGLGATAIYLISVAWVSLKYLIRIWRRV